MDKLNFYKSTKEFLSNYENKINNKLEEITLLIKEKYRNLKFLLPLIKVFDHPWVKNFEKKYNLSK